MSSAWKKANDIIKKYPNISESDFIKKQIIKNDGKAASEKYKRKMFRQIMDTK